MNVCHRMHAPLDSDIIFVEFSVNDPVQAQPLFENTDRMSFERLVRKLLNYPNHPAVVLVHAFSFNSQQQSKNFYFSSENEVSVIGDYYGLPQISLRQAVYHRFLYNDVPGFWTNVTANRNVDALTGFTFYYDNVHPDGRVGSRVLFEQAIYLIRRTGESLYHESRFAKLTSTKDLSIMKDVHLAAMRKLPVPMVKNNYESNSDLCLIGSNLLDHVGYVAGFEWINEAESIRPKWGYVGRMPGAAIEFEVDTYMTSANKDTERALRNGIEMVLVQIAHLKSYESMGTGMVTCHGGCRCKSSQLEGIWEDRTSQVSLHSIRVSSHRQCRIRIEVMGNSEEVKKQFQKFGETVPNLENVEESLKTRDKEFEAAEKKQQGKGKEVGKEEEEKEKVLLHNKGNENKMNLKRMKEVEGGETAADIKNEEKRLSRLKTLKMLDSVARTKVKITGIIVSDDLDTDFKGLINFKAVEYTGDISFRGGGTFEINNHAH
eukprot:CAMPEP_0175076088 /NCGR_PEP_ID=MMETSP0052_2-20121109/22485_1 /TAXON_ID=51329 ORGANISM="Polytomella parva, Strain SAG 63-3" /NCGR_SAMPLE_ID=MMETSP0052_2 /ASSEMBLY_ACC=CAM_ASM_000194 /LENGTH=488 /DNA_ID=CAMNT_0016345093 /DNA_START=464 /DNA_END=1930 /DNA_ORIENTATION=+